MVYAVYILKLDQKSGHTIYDILNLVKERTQYKPGCLETVLWRKDDLAHLMLYERWLSMEDLRKHIQSPLYKRLLAALDMSPEKPVIRFSDCENSMGIELIEQNLINSDDTIIQHVFSDPADQV